MKKYFVQMDTETASNRMGHSCLLLLVGIFTTLLLREILIGRFIGMCFLVVGSLSLTHAMWFGKSLKLPRWIPYLHLFINVALVGMIIVVIVGFNFLGW